MAIKSTVVTATVAAVQLDSGVTGSWENPVTVLFSVPAGGQTVFVGGPDVTSANGFPVTSGTSSPAFDLIDDPIFVCVAATTQNINVIRRGL